MFLHNYTQFIHFCILKFLANYRIFVFDRQIWIVAFSCHDELRFSFYLTRYVPQQLISCRWKSMIRGNRNIFRKHVKTRRTAIEKSRVLTERQRLTFLKRKICHADDVKQKKDRPYEPSQPTNGTFVPSMKPADCCVASPLKASKFQARTNTRVTILKRAMERERLHAVFIVERFSYQSRTSFTDATNIIKLNKIQSLYVSRVETGT